MTNPRWKQVTLGEHADFKNGVNFTAKSARDRAKVLGVGEFVNKAVIDGFENTPFVSLERPLKPDDLLVNGDFVFVRSNGSRELIGRCAMVYPRAERITFSGFVIRMRLRPGPIDARYWLYLARSELFKRALHEQGSGSYITNLSQETLASIEIMLPSLAEQQRIVAVLDAWDRAIEQTERLIAVTRRRKKALMQNLFADLPRRPLLDAAEVWFSGVDKKSSANETPVRLCNYMDVFHNNRITPEIDFMSATATAAEIAANSLRRHDVVFTKDSETMEEIAEPALIADEIDNLICGYHLAIARPREGVGHGPFLAQAMRHPEIRWQFCRLANGVVRFGLTLDAIEQAEIFDSPIAAQERIASILATEDDASDILKKNLNRLQAQKRGLMQKLLTGEWRLDTRFDPDRAAPGAPLRVEALA